MAENKKFFNILPRSETYLTMTVDSIPLRVLHSGGVKVSPDIKFNKVDLAGGESIFTNSSGVNDSFTITILLHEDDMVWNTTPPTADDFPIISTNTPVNTGVSTPINVESYFNSFRNKYVSAAKLITMLDYWIRNAEPFMIVTDAVGIPEDELWLVTEQKNRKQERNDGYVEWDLTFTLYREVKLGKFNKNTDVITKALEKKTSSTASKNTSSKTTLKDKMKKCDNKVLKYSEKKKVVDCVKVMQEIIYNAGCYGKNTKKDTAVDGWYGKTTREAVKAYKKKYKADYGLDDRYGNSVDYKTWQVMCGTAKKVGVAKANDTIAKSVKSTGARSTATVKSTSVKSTSKSSSSSNKSSSSTKTTLAVDSQKASSAKKTSSSKGKSSSSNKNSNKNQKNSNKNTTTKKG